MKKIVMIIGLLMSCNALATEQWTNGIQLASNMEKSGGQAYFIMSNQRGQSFCLCVN